MACALQHYSWMVQWSLHTTGPLLGRTSGPPTALGGCCTPVPQNGGVRRPGSGRGMRLASLGGGSEAAGVAIGGVGSAGPALAVSSDMACETTWWGPRWLQQKPSGGAGLACATSCRILQQVLIGVMQSNAPALGSCGSEDAVSRGGCALLLPPAGGVPSGGTR